MHSLRPLRSSLVLVAALGSLTFTSPAAAQLLALGTPGAESPAIRIAPVSAERIIPAQASYEQTDDASLLLVTLDGAGLGTATAVYVDGLPAVSFSIRSQTRLVALVPASASGHLTVRTAAGLAVAWLGTSEE